MKTLLVESGENKQRVYNSLMLGPKHLGIFSNELAVKVVEELAKQPLCAMDIAKRLKQNEQKVYYHLRKMKSAGIVKLNGTEARYGMTAKMYELVSPVIATKLYEAGYTTDGEDKIVDPSLEFFLRPFVLDGKLNAKIIVGDPYPHGKFDMGARDGLHIFDLALTLGRLANSRDLLNYKLDTQADSQDLKNNIILFGEPKVNTLIDEINTQLPVCFDYEKGYEIVSKASNETYDAPRVGVILKCANPWNKSKKLLIVSGIGIRGVKAAVIAITQHAEKLMETADKNGFVSRIVEGLDKDGDGAIDDVRFLE